MPRALRCSFPSLRTTTPPSPKQRCFCGSEATTTANRCCHVAQTCSLSAMWCARVRRQELVTGLLASIAADSRHRAPMCEVNSVPALLGLLHAPFQHAVVALHSATALAHLALSRNSSNPAQARSIISTKELTIAFVLLIGSGDGSEAIGAACGVGVILGALREPCSDDATCALLTALSHLLPNGTSWPRVYSLRVMPMPCPLITAVIGHR
jgi:hypothetical protein